MTPVPVVQQPDLQAFLLDVSNRLGLLETPQSPSRLYATSDLPPAADWPNCALFYSPLGVVAVSSGAQWLRQDTGAAI